MNRTRIKICGLTRMDDARAAVAAGVDAIGLVFAPSKRQISTVLASDILLMVPPFVSVIGVFVDEAVERIIQHVVELGLHGVQLHGEESFETCAHLRQVLPKGVSIIRRVRVSPNDSPDTLAERLAEDGWEDALLDPGAGDGRPFAWGIAARLSVGHPDAPAGAARIFLSGGLTPENVGEAIRIVRPYAVDVSSGVEESPGRKSAERMCAFVAAVRAADSSR